MKMNAFYFTAGLLRLTDNQNSLQQKHNKSLHHGAFSETSVFAQLAPGFENCYLHLDKYIVLYAFWTKGQKKKKIIALSNYNEVVLMEFMCLISNACSFYR